MTGRPPTCICGRCEKCKHRAHARARYQALTLEERREWIGRRDPEIVKANDRARYYRDKAKRRAAADAYQKANPEKIAEHKRAWVERNPHKRMAQIAVSNAVRDGRLIRGTACAKAGAECSGRIEAHHEDYDKPLEVVWLCKAHHAETWRIAA